MDHNTVTGNNKGPFVVAKYWLVLGVSAYLIGLVGCSAGEVGDFDTEGEMSCSYRFSRFSETWRFWCNGVDL